MKTKSYKRTFDLVKEYYLYEVKKWKRFLIYYFKNLWNYTNVHTYYQFNNLSVYNISIYKNFTEKPIKKENTTHRKTII
jgi:hypothetical protein